MSTAESFIALGGIGVGDMTAREQVRQGGFWSVFRESYQRLFRYVPGEIPVSFLNRRQKYCKDENPLC